MKTKITREEHYRRSAAICRWLGKYYHLSRLLIAKEAKLSNPDTIYEAMAGRALIPKKNLDAVEKILRIYGFKSK